eukprot:COSAG01_NODE_679_length_14296_cov_250.437575_20_plen_47_part_00
MEMFLAPGFGRDFYCCSIAGTVGRVYVEAGEGAVGRDDEFGRLAKL